MIRGSIAAIVTPMNASGELDDEGLAGLVDFHLRQGTHGLLVAGTTGESATLDFHEHIGLIRRVVDCVQGEIPVIAGTGSNCTREAIELSAAPGRSEPKPACPFTRPEPASRQPSSLGATP